ncbi:tyrosine-type recombinase/integrase [Bradyrhizobium sp. STM 3562]|uniref:tyrosine-type recombinase/integrase n=1 Tax=Bradyrhizobium sp. STM 3562 TaxID=578924 RepID=UPI00388E1BFC
MTADFVDAATVEPGKRRTIYWDKSFTNFGLMVSETGHKSYVYQYRDRNTREQSRVTFKFDLGLKKAKVAADEARLRVQLGGKPLVEIGATAPKPGSPENTFEAVATDYLKRDGAELRSKGQIESALKRLVYPTRIKSKRTKKEIAWPGIGAKQIDEILRSEIVKLLDAIADDRGPVAADRALAHIRKIMNWHETRVDSFRSPIVRGMAKTKPKARAGKRILTDEEIRDVWAGLEKVTEPACYARFVKSLLLCATRRNESAKMHSREIEGDLWTIPGERYKNKLDHVIPLTAGMKELIGDKPEEVKGNSWFIFSTTGGKKPFSGFSKAKKDLDAAIAKLRKDEGRAGMPGWTLHDLRRTARTLMTRAKVPAEHAERCMGHVLAGVEGVYNRYEYLDEKRAAFEALAAHVAWILTPPQENVIPMRADIPNLGLHRPRQET